MAKFKKHEGPDWCHLCGARTLTADVWYPTRPNAEHATHDHHGAGYGADPGATAYLRICAGCAATAAEVATGTGPAEVTRARKRRPGSRAC